MRISLLAMLICTLGSATIVARAVAAPPDADAHRMTAVFEGKSAGQILFVRQGCYQCHGLVGQGSNQSGPSLNPLRLESGAFRAYVRQPRGVMPPYGAAVLPEADLAQIEAYIRHLPPARPYKEIALLAATVPAASAGGGAAAVNGEALYAGTCAACHGVSREGGAGPSLKGEGKKHDVAAIAQLIKTPPPRMPKLYPDVVSQVQVDAIAHYLAKAD